MKLRDEHGSASRPALRDPGMDAGGEALPGDDAIQQGYQFLPLGPIQARAHLLLVLGGDLHHLAQRLSGRGGEIEGPHAPVAGDWTALQQAAILELVHEAHHPAGGKTHLFAERLLGSSLLGRDQAEEEDVAGVETEGGHPFAPQPRAMEAHLREQEGRSRHDATGSLTAHA